MGAGKRAVVVELQRSNRRTRLRGHRSAFIVGVDGGMAVVDYPGNPHAPLRARSTLGLAADTLEALAANRREVLVVFEAERSDQPIIVGLLDPRPTEAPAPETEADAPALKEARVDGRRVVLEAQDEIELRCGEASITLRRNGRVVIRGAYVETRSRGVNRIKGGSVQIN
ncbi:MAG TPA: DUF6484 domain-containing protein [Polyangiaceae bacterium]